MIQDIKRICDHCKAPMLINKNNLNDAIYYGNKTYHSSCFIELCNDRIKSKNKKTVAKWNDILMNISNIKVLSYEHFTEAVIKNEIYQFILDNYDLTIVPSTVWNKLNSIYKGNYKGMSVGIPPSHLLDMWKRKIIWLNNIARKNKIKGISMNGDQRIIYDLSILINKYDDYCRWLNNQKLKEHNKSIEKDQHIVTEIFTVTQKNISNNVDDDDELESIVDEIFES